MAVHLIKSSTVAVGHCYMPILIVVVKDRMFFHP